ncbi:MAG: translocation/assembly module TamB domain-containing protein [Bryobacterales bacterium]|nr:translocation/assembly module TamB domain-containing protein [Bryobacterales bacterium]
MTIRKRTVAIAIVAVVLALGIAALLYLRSPAMERRLLAEAARLLEQQGLRFESRQLRINWRSLSISLQGLTLAAKDAAGLPSLLTARAVHADLDAYALLRNRRVIVESVTIEAPRLHLVYLADGRSNLPTLPKSSSGPPSYRIHNLRIVDGSAFVEDQGRKLSAQVPAFTGALDFATLAQKYHVELNAPSVEVRAEDRQLTFTGLSLVLQTPPSFDSAHIEQLGVASTYGRVDLSGDVATTADAATVIQFKAAGPVPTPFQSEAAVTGKVVLPGLDFQRYNAEARLVLRGELAADASLRASGNLLRATIHSAQIPGVRVRGDLDLNTDTRINGRLAIDVHDASRALARYKSQLPAIAGRIASVVALDGTLANPQAHIQIDRAALDVAQFRSLTASGALRANLREVHIEHLELAAAGQQATVAGLVSERALDLRAHIQQAGIPALLSLFPDAKLPIEGTLDAEAHVTGSPRQAQANLTVQAVQVKAWEEQLGNIAAAGTFANNRLQISTLTVKKGAGTMTARGHYDTDPGTFSLSAAFSQFPVERYTTAVLSGKTEVHGTVESPEGTFEVTAPQLTCNGRSSGPVAVTGLLRNRHIEASARVPNYGLEATAKLPITGPTRIEFDARFRDTSLAALAVEGVQGVEGQFSGAVSGVYTDALATAQATGAITAFTGQWNKLPIRLPNQLRFSLDKGLASIEPARIELGGSHVELAGILPIQPTAAIPGLTAKATVRLADVPALFPQHLRAATGDLQLDAVVRGSFEKPQIESTLRLENASLHPTASPLPIHAIQLEGRVSEETLQLSRLEAEFSTGKVTGQGSVPLHLLVPPRYLSLPAREPARLQLAAHQVPLHAIPGVPPKLEGTFSLTLDAAATSFDINAIEATLQLPDVKLRAGEFDIALVKPATATLRKSLLQLDQLELKGPETQFRTRGYIRAAAPYAVNLSTDGNLDIALLGAFLPDWSLSGVSDFQFAIRGSLSQPTMAGFLELKDGLASTANPSLDASAVEARVAFEGNRITLQRLKGELNGGTLEGQGGLTAAFGANETFEAKNVDLRLKAANIYLEPVTGFQALADATLHLEGSSAGLSVTGDLTAQESTYNEPVLLEQALLNSLRGSTVTTLEESKPSLPVALNINVRTLSPLQINNNLLRAAIDADLRLRGTVARPGLTGRLTIDEGGQLFLNERTYTVERGAVIFTDERRIAPTLDIAARTRVNEYDITLRVQGPPGRELQTSLLSDPPMSEPDVLAVLATGRRLDELEGSESAVIREQVLSYLAGSVGGGITSKAGRAIGLSQVRIEPSLIASETEPTARLTLGQDFTRQLGLVYSMNLRDSSDQIWIGKYDITRRFTTRAVRQSDETYRFQFQHDLQFGGHKPDTASQRKQRTPQTVTKISITGDSPFPAKDIENWLGIHPGARYDFFRLRKGMERIREKHAERGHLEVRVTNTRQERPTELDLAIDIKAGPRIEFAFEGWDPSRSERKALRETWRSAAFEALRLRAVKAKAEQILSADGYLRADVSVEPRAQADHKLVFLEIIRGDRYSRARPRFTGIPKERERALLRLVEQDDLAYADPARAAALIRDRFFREGFLDAQVKTPAFSYDDAQRSALATFDIKPGPQYRVGEIRFEGAGNISDSQLRARLPFLSGAVYTPELDSKAIDSLFQAYGDSGYTDAEVEQRLRRDPFSGLVHVSYAVQEGPQRIVSEVQIAGNQYTSDNLIRTQLSVTPGEVLYDGKISQARRNLYSTGAFTIADVEVEPLGAQPDPAKKFVRIHTKVQEVRPFEIRYGGFYDTERGAGGIVDITNRNMLGGARSVGFRTRYDSTLREARAYYDQPTLLRFPVKTTATLFARRETFPGPEDGPGFYTDRIGGSVNGEYRFRHYYRLDFGYRLEQTHTFEQEPDPLFPFDIRLRIAPLTTAISRDTRDEILDATKGSFSSHAFEFAPETLGSQLRYVKYFGQYFHYRSFGGNREVPWAGVIRPRFTYAGGVRLGLATGLGGQSVIQSERFFAGGANTVRGFDRNFLGPLDFDGSPLGGNAVAIVNQELRFPLVKMFDAAAFFDAGNVSRLVSQFSNSNWRKSAGFGLRLRTPYVLLRVDYGFKLGRRPGESAGQFFFSIGQAF